MATYQIILAMANRSGGKTLAMAIISVLEARANDNCEIANLGAIQAQAQRCYRYMKAFIENSKEYKAFVRGESTINRTNFINNAMIEVLTATITGVNSPHPQKLKMDEIELISWYIIQQALNMVQSKGDIKSCTIMGSTRKFAAGPMQRLVEMSEQGNLKLFTWCIWEVMEPLPTNEHERKEIFDYLTNKNIEIPTSIDKCEGYYKWSDFINKTRLLDAEVLDSEWFCKRPQTGGLVFPRYDETLNTIRDFVLEKVEIEMGNRKIYIFEDYGYSKDHPDVILFVYVDFSHTKVVVFDELYLTEKGTDEIILEVVAKLKEHELIDPSLDYIKALQDAKVYGYRAFFNRISGWISDPHGLTEWKDRFNKGLPMVGDPEKVGKLINPELYRIINRLPLVRKFIDERNLMHTPNIVGLRNELLAYSKRKLSNGLYSDEPLKENDHGPDALGYGLINLFPELAYAAFGGETKQQRQEEEVQTFDTFTGGLMDKVF